MNILTVLNKEHALELADFLDDLSVNGHSCYEDCGICENVDSTIYGGCRTYDWMKEAFKLWPKYSGNQKYPVPISLEVLKDIPSLKNPETIRTTRQRFMTLNEMSAERFCFYYKDKWDANTQYGKDRRELCTFLANLIRSQCNEKHEECILLEKAE